MNARRKTVWGTGVAVVTAGVVAVSMGTASAITTSQTFRLHERDTGSAFIDLGTSGPSIGDQLIGSSALTDTSGAPAGTDSFVCTAVTSTARTFQCTVVYQLAHGDVTAQGVATVGTGRPLFDVLVAVTGGTRTYQNVRGQVRILQQTQTNAELFFRLLP